LENDAGLITLFEPSKTVLYLMLFALAPQAHPTLSPSVVIDASLHFFEDIVYHI
jgi:hypothetical protein